MSAGGKTNGDDTGIVHPSHKRQEEAIEETKGQDGKKYIAFSFPKDTKESLGTCSEA